MMAATAKKTKASGEAMLDPLLLGMVVPVEVPVALVEVRVAV
jgi:hypothetical protein